LVEGEDDDGGAEVGALAAQPNDPRAIRGHGD
jgi:hypothetical protein